MDVRTKILCRTADDREVESSKSHHRFGLHCLGIQKYDVLDEILMTRSSLRPEAVFSLHCSAQNNFPFLYIFHQQMTDGNILPKMIWIIAKLIGPNEH